MDDHAQKVREVARRIRNSGICLDDTVLDAAADRFEELERERDALNALASSDADAQPAIDWLERCDAARLAAIGDRDRLAALLKEAEEAGRKAANELRVIAGMDLMGASATAWNAARDLEVTLARMKEET